jgi:hypothetical protein
MLATMPMLASVRVERLEPIGSISNSAIKVAQNGSLSQMSSDKSSQVKSSPFGCLLFM